MYISKNSGFIRRRNTCRCTLRGIPAAFGLWSSSSPRYRPRSFGTTCALVAVGFHHKTVVVKTCQMGVSINGGTPKSCIFLTGFSLINHPAMEVPPSIWKCPNNPILLILKHHLNDRILDKKSWFLRGRLVLGGWDYGIFPISFAQIRHDLGILRFNFWATSGGFVGCFIRGLKTRRN